jgi:E3 ubiquitin-protein ligase TRIP12
VTIDNAKHYINLLSEAIAGKGVEQQLAALRRGFNQLLPSIAPLRVLTANELATVLCGDGEADVEWTRAQITAAIHADHGFSRDSSVVTYVIDALLSFNAVERRAFVRFCTGSGAARLPPKLTVARKDVGATPDAYLPSVNTCFVYIKLPDYSSAAVTRAKLRYAMLNAREFTFN